MSLGPKSTSSRLRKHEGLFRTTVRRTVRRVAATSESLTSREATPSGPRASQLFPPPRGNARRFSEGLSRVNHQQRVMTMTSETPPMSQEMVRADEFASSHHNTATTRNNRAFGSSTDRGNSHRNSIRTRELTLPISTRSLYPLRAPWRQSAIESSRENGHDDS